MFGILIKTNHSCAVSAMLLRSLGTITYGAVLWGRFGSLVQSKVLLLAALPIRLGAKAVVLLVLKQLLSVLSS